MPKRKTAFDDFLDIMRDRRDHEMLKKAGIKYDNYEKLPLEEHPWKDKTEILDQFTVEYCDKWDDFSNPFSIWNLYVYKDRIDIKRSVSHRFQGAEFETFRFEDIDSIICDRRKLKFIFKDGTKHFAENENLQDINGTPKRPATEIWYDKKYDEYFMFHFDKLKDIFADYRRLPQNEDISENGDSHNINIENVDVHGGNVNIGSGNIIDCSVNNIAQHIIERVDNSKDREEMLRILKEVSDSLDKMKAGQPVEENKGLMHRIKKHIKDNSWFYSDILTLAGTAFLKTMGWA